MPDSMEKKVFGSGITLLLVFLYFEVRDLRLEMKSLDHRLDKHVTEIERPACEKAETKKESTCD